MVQAEGWHRFLLALAFFVTFAVVRGTTYAIKLLPFFYGGQGQGGLHIHHLVYGIILLLVVGYLAIGFDRDAWRTPLAVAYGVAAALTLDEFALWLRLEDVYWAREGRESVDAIVLAGAVFLLGLLSSPFLRAVALELRPHRHERDTAPAP
jgi:hypothetical protein